MTIAVCLCSMFLYNYIGNCKIIMLFDYNVCQIYIYMYVFINNNIRRQRYCYKLFS